MTMWIVSYKLSLLFISTMICVQDIPDTDGDQIFGIHSFSVRLGQERVAII